MTPSAVRWIASVLFAALLPTAVLTAQESRPAGTETKRPAQTSRYRARHILIPWKGSRAAQKDTTLSKEEAKALAEKILARIKEGGKFADEARANSVCPSKTDGGDLGQYPAGGMNRAFEQAVQSAKVGDIVGPIETPLGWHIIQRLAVDKPWPDVVAGSHILIAYKGAMNARESVTRSKEEAEALAKKLLAEIKTGKTTFEDAARQTSDDPFSGRKGGDLGESQPWDFFPRFADELCSLEPGAVGKIVETPMGFHIIRREKVNRRMRASHILIPWKGAQRAADNVTRTKAEAKALALEIFVKATKPGANFGSLAKQYSSCPSRASGGDLGEFGRGQMVQEFETAVRNAKVGQIVGPVESAFGFHIIMRTQ